MKGIILVKDRRNSDGLNTRQKCAETEEEIIKWAKRFNNIADMWITIVNMGTSYKVNLKTNEVIGVRTYPIY